MLLGTEKGSNMSLTMDEGQEMPSKETDKIQLDMEKLLKISELSQILQVKVKTIYSWTHTRKIPFVKVNGALRFRKKSIDNWIEKQEKEPKNLKKILHR